MMEEPDMHDIMRGARSAARRLVLDGVPWLVYELPPALADRRSTPSLVFECDAILRRVRNYPPEWRELSDADLASLMIGL